MEQNFVVKENQEQKLVFISDKHEKFYYEKLEEVRRKDEYHKALIYTLGICHDTRRMINQIYDFKTGCVKTECLNEGWQTSGSKRVVRLAMNLYCGGTPSTDLYENSSEQLEESQKYTVDDIFCCEYAPYFVQAVKLRHPGCFIDYSKIFEELTERD